MLQILKNLIVNWIKAQFHANPIVENTGEYFSKFASALQVGVIGMVSVVALGFIGSVIVVIGAIKGWF